MTSTCSHLIFVILPLGCIVQVHLSPGSKNVSPLLSQAKQTRQANSSKKRTARVKARSTNNKQNSSSMHDARQQPTHPQCFNPSSNTVARYQDDNKHTTRSQNNTKHSPKTQSRSSTNIVRIDQPEDQRDRCEQQKTDTNSNENRCADSKEDKVTKNQLKCHLLTNSNKDNNRGLTIATT